MRAAQGAPGHWWVVMGIQNTNQSPGSRLGLAVPWVLGFQAWEGEHGLAGEPSFMNDCFQHYLKTRTGVLGGSSRGPFSSKLTYCGQDSAMDIVLGSQPGKLGFYYLQTGTSNLSSVCFHLITCKLYKTCLIITPSLPTSESNYRSESAYKRSLTNCKYDVRPYW